jgi:phosphate butyryltransferase
MKTFEELKDMLQQSGKTCRIAAVRATDDSSRQALSRAEREGMVTPVYVDADTPEDAAAKAVALIRNGEADILMKGLIGTDQLLRAILNKQTGLLPPGNVMTHMAVAELERYHKLLFITDVAVIPYPTHEQRIEQVRYAADICHHMGISEPRIALLHCAEHGGKQFPFVDGYADIRQRAEQGEFGACLVDGPMDLKCAMCPEALKAKGMQSPLAGNADVIVMPDIEAGNMLYKAMTFLIDAKTAGILCGTQCPVILPSRGDSAEAKYNSILLALASL